MEDLSRLQFVTRHYWELHGIRWMIWGIVVVFAAFEDAGWISQELMLLGIFPAGIVLFFLTIPYYRRMYGDVKPAYRHEQVRALRIANMTGALIFVLCVVSDWSGPSHLFLIPIGFAVWLFARYRAVRPYRRHLLIIACVIILLDIARTLVAGQLTPLWSNHGFVSWLLVGTGLFAVGIGDHMLLSRTMKPARVEPEHESYA